MNDQRTRSGVLRLALLRLIDGDRPWGSLDIRPDRFGVTRYRLVVYPPGISESERRRIRAVRGWPLWGALVWVICEIWLNQVTGPWTALALSTAAYVGLGLVTVAMAGPARTRVRTMAAMVMVGHYDPVARVARDKLEAHAAVLMEADARLEQGQISAAEHELTWWHVYGQLESDHPAMHRSGRGA
jgi:uncharacterized protein DUF6611